MANPTCENSPSRNTATNRQPSTPGVSVYYNSACPICNAGIKNQAQRIAPDSLTLHDIHTESPHRDSQDDAGCADIVKAVGSTREQVRERLHVVDQNGDIQIGIDAIISLWQMSPADRWKARLLSLPLLHGLSSVAYNLFARALYTWNRRKGRW